MTRRSAVLTGVVLGAVLTTAAVRTASNPSSGDWPMWGGSPERNMVSTMKGLPTTWDIKTGKNVKWVAKLGSQSYGNPVVGSGVVLVGTNNELVRDPKQPGDRGVVMAFRESDGEFLWQATHEKLSSGRVNDWPFQGVASSPLIIGDRAYYVSNRAELLCVDTQGFHDNGENDGPYTEEKFTSKADADIVWKLDMMEEVGTFPHNLANSSPVVWGDLIFVSTSNGQDESHVNIPSPRAPAIIAVNKDTGKVVWEDGSPGDKILHGQWSAPTVAKVGDVDQVVHGQGDGWVRGYEAATGKKLWEFDLNPKDSVWPKTRNEIISTPVIVDNVVYIANGQDPEHGEGVAHAYAIDATKRGDITETGRIWHFDKIRRSISTAAVHDGIVYMADFSGFVHALDAKTGKPFWTHDMFAAMWGSPMFIDGKIYIGDEDGDVVVMQAGRELKIISELNMGSSVYSTPVPANGVLYISNRNMLYALAEGASSTPSANWTTTKVTKGHTKVTMRQKSVAFVSFVSSFVTVVAVAVAAGPIVAAQWPQFRGPGGSGVADGAPPTTWNLASSSRIRWKTAIPGLGHSSPVVWNDRIYVTTAISAAGDVELDVRHSSIGMAADNDRQTWKVLALDRATGRVVWERTAYEGTPRVKRHLKSSHASATPATNGTHVVALFGSEGLYCYDAAGQLLWKQDLGTMNAGLVGDEGIQWGPASSPIIHGPLVIVQNDRQRESFLAAYELATGEQVWKVERDEFPSWATPLVVNGAAGAELVVNASKFVRAYDPMTGRELWRMADAETQVKVPSPVAGPGSVIVTGGYPRGSRPIYAIKPGTRGVIDSAATQGFAWRGDKGSPYVPTPLVYGKELYVLADNGVLTVYDAATGERRYQQRLDETPLGFSASPVGAGGHVYLASEDGDVYVVKAGPAFELVARNDMNESLMATPAIAGSMIVVRGRTHVFGIL